MIRSTKHESIYLLLLKLIGSLIGLYISVGSGSRGAWLVAPFIFMLFFIISYGDAAIGSSRAKKKVFLRLFAVSILTALAIISYLHFSSSLGSRLVSGYMEMRDWFTGENLQSSPGNRLSMWKFSFEFAKQSLLFGYGEEKNMLLTLQNSSLNITANQVAMITMAGTGPHSDILSKLLSAGLIGLAAYFLILLAPFFMFWQHRNSKDTDKKIASIIGIYYIVGIFIAGLSNEQLSLKYLCTFYGLMIATLLAQTLCEPPVKNHHASHG
jgi:O-antigen ligase